MMSWRRSEWMTLATWITLIGYLVGFSWYASAKNTLLENIISDVTDGNHGLAAHESRLVKLETSLEYQRAELDDIADAVGVHHRRHG